MSIGSSPPQKTPMLSPDGKWVWDGAQWQPIAHHESLFPSWQSITVEPAAPAAQAPRPVPMRGPAVAQPAITYGSPEQSAPLWAPKDKPTGVNWVLYFVAGVVVIVILVVVLNSVFPLWLFLSPTVSDTVTPTPRPSPIAVTQRSDFGRADQFVTSALPVAMTNLNATSTTTKETCSKALTVSCQNALTAVAPDIKYVLSVIDKAGVPACIAAPVAKVRLDLAGMDSAVQAGLKAYTDNKAADLSAAMARYTKAATPLTADVRALTNAPKAQCDAQLSGP